MFFLHIVFCTACKYVLSICKNYFALSGTRSQEFHSPRHLCCGDVTIKVIWFDLIVGKCIKKYDTYIPCRCPCPVESHSRVDGLYTLRSSHKEGYTWRLPRRLPRYINLLNPSYKSLFEFSWIHFPVYHNKWPSKRRHWKEVSAGLNTVNKTSVS